MNNNKKTIFITGGGTGGHIYPAVAVFKELKKRGHTLFYVGNKKKLEYEIANKENFDFLSVNVDGMPRKLSLGLFLWCIKTLFASIKAIFYIIKYKPDIVFGTGGYVSAPALVAAKIMKVPYMLHDCDSHPGIVSRAFSSHAKKVSVAFEDAIKLIKNKNVKVNGNPIREDFLNISKEEARNILNISQDKIVLLVMGGSQGAKTINNASKQLINYFGNNENVVLIIQTGRKKYDEFMSSVGEVPSNILIKPYFDQMSVPLIASDLVVSRAGSLSLSEICASKSPSILVPYPHAAANHQKLNADAMVNLGASVLILDNECEEKLLNCTKELLSNNDKLNSMKQNAENNAKLKATENIANELLEIAK